MSFIFFQVSFSQTNVKKLDGPRFGITLFDKGLLADIINNDRDLNSDDPIDYIQSQAWTTQIGWQWETRLVEGDGIIGLVEWVAMIGGIEKGVFIPSASALMGIRRNNGFEIAVGPTLSFTGAGLIFAVGHTFKSGELNLPINVAFVPSRTTHYLGKPNGEELGSGHALTITVGFNFNRNNK